MPAEFLVCIPAVGEENDGFLRDRKDRPIQLETKVMILHSSVPRPHPREERVW